MVEESTTLWAEVRKYSFFFGLGLAVYTCGHFPVCPECLIEKTDSRRDRQSIVTDPWLQNSPVSSCRIIIHF